MGDESRFDLYWIKADPKKALDDDRLHIEFIVAVDKTTGLAGDNVGAKLFAADFIRSTLVSWNNLEHLHNQIGGMLKLQRELIERVKTTEG